MYEEHKISFEVLNKIEVILVPNSEKHKRKIRSTLKNLYQKEIFRKYIDEMIKSSEEELEKILSENELRIKYFPGSSIKGFLRTVLMHYIYEKNRNRFKISDHNLKEIQHNKEKNRRNNDKISNDFNKLMHLIGVRDILEKDLENPELLDIKISTDITKKEKIKKLKVTMSKNLKGNFILLLDEDTYKNEREMCKNLNISENSLYDLIKNALRFYYETFKKLNVNINQITNCNLINEFPLFLGHKSGAIFKIVGSENIKDKIEEKKNKGGKLWNQGLMKIKF